MKRGYSHNPPPRPNLARPKSGYISPTEALLGAASSFLLKPTAGEGD